MSERSEQEGVSPTPDYTERDALIVVMGAHRPTWRDGWHGCSCGKEWPEHRYSPDRFIEAVDTHRADAVLAWMRENGYERREATFQREPVAPSPESAGYAEFEDWEQEMFRHQPVLSMKDGSIVGCKCLDRVLHRGTEDWGTHLASVIRQRIDAEREPVVVDDATVDRARAEVGQIAGWKHLRRYSGQTPEWMDRVRDAIIRTALRAALTPAAEGTFGQETDRG